MQTFSTCSENTRDRIREARNEVREQEGHAPREVAALNLNDENLTADAISAAYEATTARIRETCDPFDDLAFVLGEALAEVTREPARGGRSKAPTFPDRSA